MWVSNILECCYFKDLWTVGTRRVPHSNMDTQSSIESYHGALKRWLSTDVRGLQGRRVDWLVWRLCTPVSNQYMHLMKPKFNGFVVNKTIENIVQKNILKSRDIRSIHMSAPTFPGDVG